MGETRSLQGLAHFDVQFDSLFERSLDAVVGMDMDGRIIAWNSAAHDIFGWKSTEAIGALMSDMIIPHQHRVAHETGLKTYLVTGQGKVLNTRIKITALRRNGAEFPVELSILPLESSGRPVFYAYIRSREEEEKMNREREVRAREAEVLAAISAAHLEDMDTTAFIQLCLERTCELSGFSVGHFYRFDNIEAPTMLVPSGVWHIGDPKFEAAAAITDQYSFVRGQGLPGRVWKAEAPILIDDIAGDPGFSRRSEFLDIGLTKGFAFPLRNCGSLSGVMEFFGPASASAERELISFADIVGSHVELALQRKSENELREMLRRELSHRVGNSLAVLSALFRRCCTTAKDVQELRESFEPRLQAVGHAHRMVGGETISEVDLERVLRTAVDLLPETERVVLDGPSVQLASKLALPVTLILHELVTNSVKHGIWHTQGNLTVTWEVSDTNDLRLVWREAPAAPSEAEGQGYGSTLIQAMAEGTMNGSFSKGFEGDAFVARLSVPLS